MGRCSSDALHQGELPMKKSEDITVNLTAEWHFKTKRQQHSLTSYKRGTGTEISQSGMQCHTLILSVDLCPTLKWHKALKSALHYKASDHVRVGVCVAQRQTALYPLCMGEEQMVILVLLASQQSELAHPSQCKFLKLH